MTYRKAVCRGTVSAAALIFAASIGNTQAQPAAPAAEEKAERPVEKVVVTAQKRPQQLQDVPITVTTVSGELFKDTGSKDIKDLQILVPGMTVTSTSSEASTTARIRGIGTVGDNPGLESSVGIVIDGVYRPRNSVGFGDLGEVSRIEVIKGPQSSVFGKNTSAGVISVITAGPDSEFGAQGEFTAGSFGALGGSASITGPLGEGLAARLFGVRRVRDGYYDIVTGGGPRTQDDDADSDYHSVRGQVLFEPSDNLTWRIIADVSQRDEQCCAAVALSHQQATTGAFFGTTLRGDHVASQINLVQPNSIANGALRPFDYLAYANFDNNQDLDDGGISSQVDWDFGSHATLTSVTAWRQWEVSRSSDPDYNAADILRVPQDGNNASVTEQFSQELRLAGDWSWGTWLVGFFYSTEDLSFRTSVTTGGLSTAPGPAGLTQQEEYYARRFLGTTSFNAFNAAAFPTAPYIAFQGTQDAHFQTTDSWAFFTNESFEFWDGMELTLGLRYTHEEKEMASLYDNQNANTPCANLRTNFGALAVNPWWAVETPGEPGATRRSTWIGTVCSTGGDPIFDNLANFQSQSENELTGNAKLSYRFNEDFMAYGSYARGYKAGGLNLDRERTGAIQQVPGTVGGPVVDLNTSFPAELVDAYEAGAKTSWFNGTVLFNTAFFHQVYENFQLNTFTGTQFIVASVPEVISKGVDTDFVLFSPIEGLSVQGGATYALTQYGDFPVTAGLTARHPGSRISFGPMWSATMAATYERTIGTNLVLRTNLAGKFSSKYNTGSDLNPFKVQEEYVVFNARMGIGAEDESWVVELWGQNIFDQEILQVAFDAPAQSDITAAFLAPPATFGITLRGRY